MDESDVEEDEDEEDEEDEEAVDEQNARRGIARVGAERSARRSKIVAIVPKVRRFRRRGDPGG